MGRPGRHFVFDQDSNFKGRCGPVQSVYARHGSQWETVGRMCLTCHSFWPALVPARLKEPGEINVEEREAAVHQPPQPSPQGWVVVGPDPSNAPRGATKA